MHEVIIALVAFGYVGTLLVATSKDFQRAIFKKKWGLVTALTAVAIIVVWLGLHFLYAFLYWWIAWTMSVVLHLGILNLTLFTSLFLIYPEFMGGILLSHIFTFYGIFTYSVMPLFLYIAVTFPPFTIIAIVTMVVKFRKLNEGGGSTRSIAVIRIVGVLLILLQFPIILILLFLNPWAQMYISTAFFLWGYAELLITIFLPITILVIIPERIIDAIIGET
ncbi:MAG: hypothetical protein ACETWM_07345 [Candidatus Lokiarchaeia archaeon]